MSAKRSSRTPTPPASVGRPGLALDARVIVRRASFRLDAAVTAEPGEVVAVMGPSGAGKSTLLAVLAGLGRLDEGHVRLGDRYLDAARAPRRHRVIDPASRDAAMPRRARTAPAQRGVVLLGQEPRLFPHLSAHANITFGLRVHGLARDVARGEADEWLWRVGLDGLGGRRPDQLSGGQQQRVALARALATSPALLLLDEPLTALDTETAGDVRALLRDALASTRTTTLVATHDAVDAVALGSRLIVLEEGAVTQSGGVREVLAAPATRFAAAVAGLNRVDGTIAQGRWSGGELSLAVPGDSAGPEGDAAAVFRPSAVGITRVEASTWTGALRLDSTAPPAPDGEWLARITRLEQIPAGVRLRTTSPEVSVDLPAERVAELGLAAGQPVRLRVDPDDVRLVPAVPAVPAAASPARVDSRA